MALCFLYLHFGNQKGCNSFKIAAAACLALAYVNTQHIYWKRVTGPPSVCAVHLSLSLRAMTIQRRRLPRILITRPLEAALRRATTHARQSVGSEGMGGFSALASARFFTNS